MRETGSTRPSGTETPASRTPSPPSGNDNNRRPAFQNATRSATALAPTPSPTSPSREGGSSQSSSSGSTSTASTSDLRSDARVEGDGASNSDSGSGGNGGSSDTRGSATTGGEAKAPDVSGVLTQNATVGDLRQAKADLESAAKTATGEELQEIQSQLSQVNQQLSREEDPPQATASTAVPASMQDEAAQQAQLQTLNERAEALRPGVEVMSEVEAGIVQYNLSQLRQMGVNQLQQSNPDIPAPLQSLIPVDLKNLPTEEAQKLRAMVEEETLQARDDLRAGRMSAVLNSQDYANLGREESLALMRVQQGLQEAGIPQDFNGKSPTNQEELRSLQTLGYVEEVASARSIHQELQTLYSEQAQLNQQRAEVGLEPVEIPALTESLQRMEALDQHIVAAGKEMYEGLGGFGSDLRPAFSEKPLMTEERPQGLSASDPQILLTPTDLANIFPGEGPLSLNQAQTDELIRVNDSLNLLQGNASGLSIKDIPMSPELRNALNIPPEVGSPLAPFNPFLSTQAAIDHIALLPAEDRAQRVASVGRGIIGQSVHQSAVTQAIGEDLSTNLMGRLTGAQSVSAQYGELASLNTDATAQMATLAAQTALYGNHAQAIDMLRSASGFTSEMRADNTKLESLDQELRMASGHLVSDTLLGFTGLSAIAKQGGKAAAGNVAREVGRNVSRKELASLSQTGLERLARDEASSVLRNQLSRVTRADMTQQTRSSLASLTQQQASAQGEAFVEVATKALGTGPPPSKTVLNQVARDSSELPSLPIFRQEAASAGSPPPRNSLVPSSPGPTRATASIKPTELPPNTPPSRAEVPSEIANIFEPPERGVVGSMMDSVLNTPVRNLRKTTANLPPVGSGQFNQVFSVPNPQGEAAYVLRVPQTVYDNANFRVTGITNNTTPINYPPPVARAIEEGRVALPSKVATVVIEPRGMARVPETTSQVQLLNYVDMDVLGKRPVADQAKFLGGLSPNQVQEFATLQGQLKAVGIQSELAPQNLGINRSTGNLVFFDVEDIPVYSVNQYASGARRMELTPRELGSLRQLNLTSELDGLVPNMRQSIMFQTQGAEQTEALRALGQFERNLEEAFSNLAKGSQALTGP